MLRPEHRNIRLRRGPEIGERVQHAVAALGHQRVAVQIHAADAFGCPIRIAAEQRVVFGRAKEADDAELLDELIPQFLRARFVERALAHVALDIDVEEARDAADRHRRAVRFLDRSEIGEIGPLHGFLRIGRRARNVEAVEFRHRGEVFQRAHLLRQLFARPDHVVARPHVIDLRPLGPLGLKQPVHAVKGDAPVVADDAAAAIGIGKAGDDAGLPALHDLGRIGVEHPVIVALAVFRERFAGPAGPPRTPPLSGQLRPCAGRRTERSRA